MKKLLMFCVSSLLFSMATMEATLMNIIKINPTILLDIRYATSNNFTGKAVYQKAECYLQEEAALALSEAQDEFLQQGLSLKVFDAYRPLSVQKIFWDLVPDERYVANPAQGSRHNRGCAVDVTLVDLKTGVELDMGTEFDDFTEKAHRTTQDFDPEVLSNRQLLESVMLKHSFIGLPTEWWHYDFKDWQAYPILDVPFEELNDTILKD